MMIDSLLQSLPEVKSDLDKKRDFDPDEDEIPLLEITKITYILMVIGFSKVEDTERSSESLMRMVF